MDIPINENCFDLRERRAMVSLGPLNKRRYCSYSCPFCYVNVGFTSYPSMPIKKIFLWLQERIQEFDIIYISGDTDSFAPPRTDKGIELLEILSELNVDLLFTTKAIFSSTQLNKLKTVSDKLKSNDKALFGCVSIAQLHNEYLEPKPIFPPELRIKQLHSFKEMGIVSVHAMRPFLPVVPINEYLELIDLVKKSVDIILGEAWFCDKEGILESKVFRNSIPASVEYEIRTMDFDNNTKIWKVYNATQIESIVSTRCKELNIPFFMRSQPAIEWYRNENNLK